MGLRFLLPLGLALTGFAAGGAAGYFLHISPETELAETAEAAAQTDGEKAYVKMNSQFIVPILDKGRVVSLVVLALSLEVTAGESEAAMAREPKLRAAFLQLLFDHANSGGFKGSFTEASNLTSLRRALREEAQSVLGPRVTDVLITEIGRQDS